MESEITVAVDVPQIGDERRKNWAKVVTAVDDSLASGWAFDGEFVATGGIQDLPIDAVLVIYGEKGSRNNPAIEARAYTVNSDGTLSFHTSARGRAWARTLRDPVEELLTDSPAEAMTQLPWHPELMKYTDDALREELARRSP